jgi:allantoin racemase
MAMRIALIHITEMPEAFRDYWTGMVLRSVEAAIRSDTEVVLRPIAKGLKGDNVLDFDHPYFALLDRGSVVEAMVAAHREGFDAAVVHCFGDPGVAEARAAVDMPIFGPAESGLHLACQLGRKLAIVGTNMPGQRAQLEEQVRAHRLEGRLIPDGIRFDERPFAEVWPQWLGEPKLCAEAVEQVARKAVADGADAVVLGCAAKCLFCSTVGMTKVEVDGCEVPIVDAVIAALKTAEMAVDIRRGTGMPITSRSGGRKLPSEEDWARVRKAFDLEV